MTADELLAEWRTAFAELELVEENAPHGNMWTFSIAPAQDVGVSTAALADFVRDAHRAYAQAAHRLGREGWFYAWHDEMAGQLRTSACWITSVDELPFGGLIEVVADAESLATALLASDVAHGIPWSQLVEVPFDNSPEPEAPLPTLVYARPLSATVGS